MDTEAIPRQLEIYATADGVEPFEEWMAALKDQSARAAVRARLERVEDGDFGDHHALGEGVSELRIDFGPGYRVYYGLDGKVIVVLLSGGDKSAQEKDIKKAKQYWQDYLRRG